MQHDAGSKRMVRAELWMHMDASDCSFLSSVICRHKALCDMQACYYYDPKWLEPFDATLTMLKNHVALVKLRAKKSNFPNSGLEVTVTYRRNRSGNFQRLPRYKGFNRRSICMSMLKMKGTWMKNIDESRQLSCLVRLLRKKDWRLMMQWMLSFRYLRLIHDNVLCLSLKTLRAYVTVWCLQNLSRFPVFFVT